MIIGTTQVNIAPNYSPVCSYAMRWGEALNGSPFVVDRGADCDIHSCNVTITGTDDNVFGAYALFKGDSGTGILSVVLTSGELIFGPNTAISGDSIDIIVDEVGDIERNGLNIFGFTAKISCDAPEWTEISATAPTEFFPEFGQKVSTRNGVQATRPYDIVNGGTSVNKWDEDFASFTFSQLFDADEAQALQVYYEIVNRGSKVLSASAPTLQGISYPFGPSYSYPCDFRYKSMRFIPVGPRFWRVNIIMQRA
jgi:hypothetical protein